jgi:hypothetical protein
MRDFSGSAYSQSGIALNKDDGGGDADEGSDYSTVVVLTSR